MLIDKVKTEGDFTWTGRVLAEAGSWESEPPEKTKVYEKSQR